LGRELWQKAGNAVQCMLNWVLSEGTKHCPNSVVITNEERSQTQEKEE